MVERATAGRGGNCAHRALRSALLSLFLALGFLAASGCSVHKAATRVDPPTPMPQRFRSTALAAQPPDTWWKTFADPALDEMVERLLTENLSLRAAWARLDQAHALARQAGAVLKPTVDLTASAARARVDKPTAPRTHTDNLFSVGAVASYEMDLWGRLRGIRNAAEMEYRASREDLDALAIGLAATLADTWYALTEQRAQRALLQEQLQVSETFMELTELRFGQGQASALDVYQQRQQLAATRAQFAPIEAQTRVLEHRLAVLLGGAGDPPMGREAARAALPELTPLEGVGIPADLLQRRPDVRAAHHRLEAADHRVATAVADRFPALRLTAGGSFQDDKVLDVFHNHVWNLAAGLTAPVFDAGRRKAEADRAKAAVVERLNAWGETVLNAVREVEDALAQEQQQAIFLKDVDGQVDLARKTLEEARSRYVNGLTDYLNVLTALQVLHGLQRQRLTAHRQLIGFRIGLFRALGGAWPDELKPTVEMHSLR